MRLKCVDPVISLPHIAPPPPQETEMSGCLACPRVHKKKQRPWQPGHTVPPLLQTTISSHVAWMHRDLADEPMDTSKPRGTSFILPEKQACHYETMHLLTKTSRNPCRYIISGGSHPPNLRSVRSTILQLSKVQDLAVCMKLL